MSAGTQPVLIPWSPAPAQLTMAYSVCRGITRANAKNFYYAFLVLPKRKRQALCAVYAFMRRCDDIADDPTLTLEERHQKLDNWLDALHRVQQGQPSDDPILLALNDAQRSYTIPAGLLDELAMGTAMDVVDPAAETQGMSVSPNSATPQLTVQYRTFEDLKLYCYRVASTSSDIATPQPSPSPSSAASPFNSPTLFAMSKKTPRWAASIFPKRI
jgi:phytoene synthase